MVGMSVGMKAKCNSQMYVTSPLYRHDVTHLVLLEAYSCLTRLPSHNSTLGSY